ncbi:MAG: DUF1351 domain-containing protein [Oscillospiraceae bacterium]|nr:DUF1351 domain-containing protein [Oscillospiraceae bacterium]
MSGAMTEFRITSDLGALRAQVIDANFDEVRAWLDDNLAPYRSMAVTEDDIMTAKNYRAAIRKVRDRIDESRKEAKAAALAAYSEFESRCKVLTGICDEAANALDEQVKAFENAERKKKLEALRADYIALTDEELEEYCPWETLVQDRWGNKSFSYDAAVAYIREALDKTTADLSAIREMGGEDTAYLLDVYKQTHDLSAVVRKASELKTMRERETARKREAEATNTLMDAVKAVAAERVAEIVSSSATDEEPLLTVDFRVTCTKTQLHALGEYLRSNGIKYGRVT